MSPARENQAVDGDDGIRARKSGTWARVKLSFLDDFIPPALQVVGKSKHPLSQRWYVDLFAGPVPAANLHEIHGDANEVLPGVLSRIDPYAYALIVADITRPAHWPWSSTMAVRAQGHRSIDFYMLFPLWTAINRMMPWKAEAVEPNAPALDRFFGTNEWRSSMPRRTTDGKGPEFRRGSSNSIPTDSSVSRAGSMRSQCVLRADGGLGCTR